MWKVQFEHTARDARVFSSKSASRQEAHVLRVRIEHGVRDRELGALSMRHYTHACSSRKRRLVLVPI